MYRRNSFTIIPLVYVCLRMSLSMAFERYPRNATSQIDADDPFLDKHKKTLPSLVHLNLFFAMYLINVASISVVSKSWSVQGFYLEVRQLLWLPLCFLTGIGVIPLWKEVYSKKESIYSQGNELFPLAQIPFQKGDQTIVTDFHHLRVSALLCSV